VVTNPVFATKDTATGELRGVAVDLGRELANQLGVAFQPVEYVTVPRMLDGAKAPEWDVAFVADRTRAGDIELTAAYMEVDNTYLVPTDSPIRMIDDVDRPGHRIAVTQQRAADQALSRTLKHAELLRAPQLDTKAAFDLLTSGRAHALAGNREELLEFAARLPGSRVLEGRFYGSPLALAVIKGRPAGAAYAREFIEYAKASGTVQRAIEQAKLRGVTVAPASSNKAT
jgi:polar amino acid transport system substrate-binding protein